MTYFSVDGTEDNFYTAVFDAYKIKECIITSEPSVQLELGAEIVDVVTDPDKCGRVKKKLRTLDRGCLDDVNLLLRSNAPLKENVAFDYIKMIIANGGPVRGMLADPTVIEMTDIRRRVTDEAHKMKGFLRFMENENGVLYAPYTPDNDITDMLALHFSARFSSKQFVIHDLRRKICAMYDGNEIIMTGAGDAEIYLSEYEAYFQNLWREYYESVNIASRPHEKQMRGYMPVRYWKFLPEKRR